VKIVFLGSGTFALPVVDALDAAGYRPALVVSQPPRRRRRRGEAEPTPVHQRALEWGVPVHAPAKVNLPESLDVLRDRVADLFVVAEYGQILSQALLDIPRLGSINVHGSLLPRWRGATPVEAAILAGDTETGVAIQRVVRELDAGAVIATRAVAIGPADDTGSLRERLALMGGELAAEVVARFAAGEPLPGDEQDGSAVTVCRRLKTEDLWLDWSKSAAELERQVRAFRPRPLARTRLLREPPVDMKVVAAEVVEALDGEGAAEPGQVATADRDGICVGTGDGLLRLLEIVPAARKPMTAGAFANGARLSSADRFAAADDAPGEASRSSQRGGS